MMQATESLTGALVERRANAVVRGVNSAYPVFVDRAEGVRVWDQDGREYLDFVAGIGTLNLGHRHPRIVAAIRDQVDRFTHTCFQVVQYPGYVEVAERLNRLVPGSAPKKTLLLSTGAEAAENAIKIARNATGRPAVIAFRYGYHGRTLLALTLTGKVAPYRQNFGPYAPEVYHARYPFPLHGDDTASALTSLHELFETAVAPNRVAAIVVEPVLGEGGFVPAPPEFLRALREIADQHGILLVVDEIQTGFGRTGTMLAIEHAGVVPDIVLLAKSLAGGLPLSAVVGRADVMDSVDPGGLGGTFAGNPLACAAALATLDVFEEEDILARAQAVGRGVRSALDKLARTHAEVAEVRGLGAMLAVEFRDAPLDERGRTTAKRIAEDARERGLILLTAGPHGNTIRFLVPLVASDSDVQLGMERFADACASVLGPKGSRPSSA
jgi:4-aminobutyrate aminotransferase/(S)-3-amino-2-methylpropionate transaminase